MWWLGLVPFMIFTYVALIGYAGDKLFVIDRWWSVPTMVTLALTGVALIATYIVCILANSF